MTRSIMKFLRRTSTAGLTAGLMAASICATALVRAEEPPLSRQQLKQPIYRVSNNPKTGESDLDVQRAAESHPLDAALVKAREGLKVCREDIKDYTCVLVKRERVNGTLMNHEFMFTKIRNRKVVDGQIDVPLSVYMNFLKPATVKGREALWVEGQNGGKMIAHEGQGFLVNKISVWLRPDGPIAMRNNNYPITEVGIENLIVRLIEKGERDRKRGECDVTFRENAKINGRVCTLLEVTHPVPRPYFDFHKAQIFIDDEYKIPIRYAAFDWPTQPGDSPPVIEEYTYLNLKLNVGLTDFDFDPKNPNYNF